MTESMPAPASRATFPDDHTLVLEREFAASPEAVFRAFTDPAALAAWWGPWGLAAKVLELDLRAGGRYRIDKRSADGEVYRLTGEYVEIEPPHRLSFTWSWLDEPGLGDTLVTVELSPRGVGGTALRLVHSRFPDAKPRAQHTSGWESSLEKLADYLEQEHDVMDKPILYGAARRGKNGASG